tara:strand:- start:4227 stop:5393 length:1167 start_codon:yes stop_codon:yes gene_type:complete
MGICIKIKGTSGIMGVKKLFGKIFSPNLNRNFKGGPVVGVDISSAVIKLIEIEPSGQGYQVTAYGVETLPNGAVFDREIVDIEATGAALQALYKRSGARSRNIAVAVSGSSVISNYVDLPSSLTYKQVEARVAVEAESIIPFPLNEIYLDFSILGPNTDNISTRVQIVASQRDYVDRRREVVEFAGLNPVAVDVESFAFARAYEALINFDSDKKSKQGPSTADSEVVGIVDIGASQFTFVVIRDHVVIYSIEQPFGGRQLTEDIQRQYHLTWAEAGRAKRKGGLDEDYVQAMLNPFKTMLMEHVKRSLRVFYSSTETNKIDKLVLSGGVSKTDGLREQVTKETGIPTLIVDLSKNVSLVHASDRVRLSDDTPSMMLALGLSLTKARQL